MDQEIKEEIARLRSEIDALRVRQAVPMRILSVRLPASLVARLRAATTDTDSTRAIVTRALERELAGGGQ